MVYLNFDEDSSNPKLKISKDVVYFAMSEGFQNTDINLEKE